MSRSLDKQDDVMDESNKYFSLSTYRYLGELPEGHEVLRENYGGSPLSEPEMPCTQQIPALISSVRDLVKALSSNPQTAAAVPDTFGVQEAALRLGCSQGQVRKLIHEGKLSHHWVGKNLRFRQTDLEQFWASQTRLGADKTSTKRLSDGRDRKGSETKRKDFEASSLPTRREVDKLWR